MLIVGDWAPQKEKIHVELFDDLLILNLEGPYILEPPSLNEELINQSKKCGPILYNLSLPDFRGKIFYGLANNHFSDLGERSSQFSLDSITAQGNSFTGYGKNSKHSNSPEYFSYENKKIGFLAVTERQFGEATNHDPGVAVVGAWIYPMISEMQKNCDFVILSIHAGAEDYPWPLPYWQEQYRSYISCGVDLVVGHHPHIPQGFEQFGDGFIAYGLGNFGVEANLWKNSYGGLWSLAIQVRLVQDKFKISVIHLEQKQQMSDENSSVVQISTNPRFIEFVEDLNETLKKPEILHHLWLHLASDLWESYLADFYRGIFEKKSGLALSVFKVKRIIKHVLGKIDNSQKSRHRLYAYHGFSCETHRQIAMLAMSEKNCSDEKTCSEATLLLNSFKALTMES